MHVAPVNIKILAYTLEVEGYDTAPFLRACGVDTLDALDEDGQWLPVEQFDQRMADALAITRDPAFGLIAGKSLALMRYGAITPVVLATPPLRQMLADIAHYASLSVPQSEIVLDDTPALARLLIQPVVQGGASGWFRLDLVATSAMQMLRLAGAGHTEVRAVHLPYPAPRAGSVRYSSTFGPHVEFGRTPCQIQFDPALLDRPLPSHDPVAYAAARSRADALLSAMQARTDVAELIREALLRTLPAVPTLTEMARELGQAERTLRRHLAALDTNYADLVQECQRLVAERLLAEGRVPLKQIAASLGFASVHSFHRAFRRWFGQTPATWRARGGVLAHGTPAPQDSLARAGHKVAAAGKGAQPSDP